MLDSTVLILLERNGTEPGRLAAMHDEELLITAVSISELQFGFHRAADEIQRQTRKAFMSSVLETFHILPFDVEAALIHGRVWADLSASGQRIGVQDSIIAAIALANDHAVMTDNVREFSRVIGLELRPVSLP